MIVNPSGCRYCGINAREHARRWMSPVGWHQWTQPTQEQIKARMLARRAAQSVAEDDEGLSGPCDCGEGAVHYTDADCPAAQRAAVETHVVADDSSDPEHIDDCPGCDGTRPCGHDDYHDAHEWADRPGVWCPGITYADDEPTAARP